MNDRAVDRQITLNLILIDIFATIVDCPLHSGSALLARSTDWYSQNNLALHFDTIGFPL